MKTKYQQGYHAKHGNNAEYLVLIDKLVLEFEPAIVF